MRKEIPTSVKIFDKIAEKYEFTAYFLSFGILPYWFKKLEEVLPEGNKKELVLDLACGTGILFNRLTKKGYGTIVGLDYSLPMLKVAQRKNLAFLVRGDALELPFKNEKFHLVVVSLGLRHFQSPRKALQEIYRVLKPTGKVFILEVGIPKNEFLRRIFLKFLEKVILPLGKIRAKEEVYEHLLGSIINFPHYEGLLEIMKDIGFKKRGYKPIMGGLAVIYEGEKF